MKRLLILALLNYSSLADTINGKCERKCQEDCMEVGKNYEWSNRNCQMVYGTGTKGIGWYIANNNKGNQFVSCMKSCEEICDDLCHSRKEGAPDQIAENRWYANQGGGRYKNQTDMRELLSDRNFLTVPNFLAFFEILLHLILNLIINQFQQ